ncbi:PREDICTED: leucine-rich repeat and fibronectin type-III domain-containing protein 3 [Ceratosolen solmsi marchali]|uniref:Leucine-rich repeat and fibronectin type-III domain-containing protein 3 n=1 Tax=Ceratosolen solmsi marchali TaxID=326594 RepID=A0AAJ6YY67_9HYME|nr:PREDICTED: leucine-rich repeat and fibronectin type-III domain-containing protein 3 [Ceratosolen solmsi marchali]
MKADGDSKSGHRRDRTTSIDMRRTRLLLAVLVQAIMVGPSLGSSPCPWSAQGLAELESSCTCDYNLALELSVQCDAVDLGQLLAGLRRFASAQARIDLLYVNNSTIGQLRNGTFIGLRISNLQLSGCKLRGIEPEAFIGQASSLRSLNLRDNDLQELPRAALAGLKNLTVLDLSRNRIARVPEHAFIGHRLVTLKLAGNSELVLEPASFRGLEHSLKNLNLMGTRQRRLPEALKGLAVLAFLDLSQNSIRELGGSAGFQGLASLTGLNLERNLIQAIGSDAFVGVSSTLTSLSLLNNLIPEFPTNAIASLRELKVLDIGFNLMTELPVRAFEGNPSITLLAIDGNPLSSVPEEAFVGLIGTLRGLSLGGRFLMCDCKLRWIVEWIHTRELQVTSRESKPQFCGSPQRLQDKSFYAIKPEEMTCERHTEIVGFGTVESVEPTGALLDALETNQQQSGPSLSSGILGSSTSSAKPMSTNFEVSTNSGSTVATHTPTFLAQPTSTKRSTNVFVTRTSVAPRPPLVLGSPLYKSKSQEKDIIVKDVLRQDNSVIIRWDSESLALGFRVIYRLFGDSTFKSGPPLENSEREFKIKNVPSQECIIVCVVGAEEAPNPNPASVPYSQCREVRTEGSPTSNMDRITIAASAAICATIVAAVLIFLLANRRRRRTSSRKLHTLQEPGKLPIAGLPVNCCSSLVGPTPSPGAMGGPLPGAQASLSAYSVQKEWDQLSAYSTRSIPRPRIFPVERQGSVTRASCLEEAAPPGPGSLTVPNHARGHYFPGASLGSSLVGLGARPELRHSRQSLAATSERMARGGFSSGVQLAPQAQSSARRQRPRSRNRGMEPSLPRPGSRYSLAESTHTLNNYEEGNWTDHDMDIYMARNPTTRGGLVPL